MSTHAWFCVMGDLPIHLISFILFYQSVSVFHVTYLSGTMLSRHRNWKIYTQFTPGAPVMNNTNRIKINFN